MDTQIFCPWPLTRCRITAEGNVAFCCFMRPDPAKEESAAYLGNMLESRFDDVWFGPIAEEVRLATLDGRLHEKCQCPGCPFVGAKTPYPKHHVIYNEYPVFLEIDLPNTHCNIGGNRPDPMLSPACIMCERASPLFRPEQDRLLEVLARISYLVPNLAQIHIQGIAEPFWKKLLFQMLDVLEFDKYKKQIIVSTTTNGVPLNGTVRKEYLKRVPKSITNFSIDAATPETYQAIRILNEAGFRRVLEHLFAFDQERNPELQKLRVVMNVNTMNMHEVMQVIDIAEQAHAVFVFGPTYGFNDKILMNNSNYGKFASLHYDIVSELKRRKMEYEIIKPLDGGLLGSMIF